MAETESKKPATPAVKFVVGSTLEYARLKGAELGISSANCVSVDQLDQVPAGAETVTAKMAGDKSNLWKRVK